ncbi:hypothetical protein, partial [Staphylococcus aureus]
RYFFGDPIRISSRLYTSYPKQEQLNMIKTFLHADTEH